MLKSKNLSVFYFLILINFSIVTTPHKKNAPKTIFLIKLKCESLHKYKIEIVEFDHRSYGRFLEKKGKSKAVVKIPPYPLYLR